MAEYIDRESIRKAIQSVTNDPNCPLFIAAMIEQYIDEEPSADVAPVKHGKWEYEHGAWQCSNCGEDNPYGIDYDTARFSKYCPNCGAKMDGEGYS